jgi:hypothetical protein
VGGIASCDTVTILEMSVPVWNETAGYMSSEYQQVWDDEYHVLDLEADQPSFTF